jgi:hypothetical protein
MSTIDDSSPRCYGIAFGYPKSGGAWVIESFVTDDPRILELNRRDKFDFDGKRRSGEAEVLLSGGARLFANPSESVIAVTQLQQKRLSVPTGPYIPSDWPEDWKEILNEVPWPNNNFVQWQPDGGVWVLPGLTATQAIDLQRKLYRRYREVDADYFDYVAKIIQDIGGTFFADLQDPAFIKLAGGRSALNDTRPDPDQDEYWEQAVAPWLVQGQS